MIGGSRQAKITTRPVVTEPSDRALPLPRRGQEMAAMAVAVGTSCGSSARRGIEGRFREKRLRRCRERRDRNRVERARRVRVQAGEGEAGEMRNLAAEKYLEMTR